MIEEITARDLRCFIGFTSKLKKINHKRPTNHDEHDEQVLSSQENILSKCEVKSNKVRNFNLEWQICCRFLCYKDCCL